MRIPETTSNFGRVHSDDCKTVRSVGLLSNDSTESWLTICSLRRVKVSSCYGDAYVVDE